jgi:hypothetical protein
MSNQVHLFEGILGPQIDIEDIHGMLDFTVAAACTRSAADPCIKPIVEGATHLQSISLPVFASFTMSLTHGGGVMGRRSYPGVSRDHTAGEPEAKSEVKRTLSPKPHIRARCGCCTTSRLPSSG